jgi:hypothetical protein
MILIILNYQSSQNLDLNLKPKTQNPKPKTLNPKPLTLNP